MKQVFCGGCGTIWSGFEGVCEQKVILWWVWGSLEWICGSEYVTGGFVVGVGQFGLGLGSECAAGGFVVGLGKFGVGLRCECAAGGFVVCV